VDPSVTGLVDLYHSFYHIDLSMMPSGILIIQRRARRIVNTADLQAELQKRHIPAKHMILEDHSIPLQMEADGNAWSRIDWTDVSEI
jgi:hypothetical protein